VGLTIARSPVPAITVPVIATITVAPVVAMAAFERQHATPAHHRDGQR
jgi:hypothetical protein